MPHFLPFRLLWWHKDVSNVKTTSYNAVYNLYQNEILVYSESCWLNFRPFRMLDILALGRKGPGFFSYLWLHILCYTWLISRAQESPEIMSFSSCSALRDRVTFQWEGLSSWECCFQILFLFHSCKKYSEIHISEVGMWRVPFPRFFCFFSLSEVKPDRARLRCLIFPTNADSSSWILALGGTETKQAHTVIVPLALYPLPFWISYFLSPGSLCSPFPYYSSGLPFHSQI